MRINIVCKTGWILERLARELVERVAGVTLNAGQNTRAIDPRADFNYYFPAKDLNKYPTDGGAIGFYTHGDNALDLIPRFAACHAMNSTMATRLENLGAAGVRVLRPGTEAPVRPITFGVIGRVYNDGRKGEKLVELAVADGFRFVACQVHPRGRNVRALAREQWPCEAPYTVGNREAFYSAIDYLVVTSTLEGGPMPVLEAIARGVPVIAPNVGFCWEFPVIRYAVGEYGSLRAVLEALSRPPSWEAWGNDHRVAFEALELSRKV